MAVLKSSLPNSPSDFSMSLCFSSYPNVYQCSKSTRNISTLFSHFAQIGHAFSSGSVWTEAFRINWNLCWPAHGRKLFRHVLLLFGIGGVNVSINWMRGWKCSFFVYDFWLFANDVVYVLSFLTLSTDDIWLINLNFLFYSLHIIRGFLLCFYLLKLFYFVFYF